MLTEGRRQPRGTAIGARVIDDEQFDFRSLLIAVLGESGKDRGQEFSEQFAAIPIRDNDTDISHIGSRPSAKPSESKPSNGPRRAAALADWRRAAQAQRISPLRSSSARASATRSMAVCPSSHAA